MDQSQSLTIAHILMHTHIHTRTHTHTHTLNVCTFLDFIVQYPWHQCQPNSDRGSECAYRLLAPQYTLPHTKRAGDAAALKETTRLYCTDIAAIGGAQDSDTHTTLKDKMVCVHL